MKGAPAAERPVGQTRRIRIGAPVDGRAAEFRLIGRGSVPTEDAVQRDASDPGELTVRGARVPDAVPDAADESASVAGPDAVPTTPIVARSADRSDEPSVPVSRDAEASLGVPDLPVPVTFTPALPRPTVRPLVGRLGARSGGSTTMPEPASQPSSTTSAALQREARPPVDAILANLAGGSGMRPQAETPRIRRGESTSSPTVEPSEAVGTWTSGALPGPPPAESAWSRRPSAAMPTVARSVADTPGRSVAPTRTADPATWQAPIRRMATAPARTAPMPSTPALATSAGLSVQASSASPTRHTFAQTAPAKSPESAGPSAGSPQDGAAAPIELFADASVQRSIDAASDAEPAISLAPVVSRQADEAGGDAGGAATSGGATPGAGSEKELDELARKLFPRLQLRFRHELLVDRERIGTLVDFGR